MTKRAIGLLAAPLIWVAGQSSEAAPVFAIDLNPTLAGIQNVATVNPSDILTAQVVLYNDATVDTIGFAAARINSVTSSVAAFSSALIAGSLVNMFAPDTVIDLATGNPTSTGFALSDAGGGSTNSGATISGGFSTTGMGINVPVDTTAPILSFFSAFSFEITAAAIGTSVVEFSATLPFTVAGGDTSFNVFPATLQGLPATINVVAPAAVPEPSVVLMLGLGLLGVGSSRQRQKIA